MVIQDEENPLIVNEHTTKNNNSKNQDGFTINITRRCTCMTLSWVFGIIALGIFIGLMIFAGISDCHVEEGYPTIYNKKEEITVYNSSGRYVNITLCQTNNDTKTCSVYVCKISLFDNGKYSANYKSCNNINKSRPGDKVKVHYTDNMVQNNVVSQCPFKCKYCKIYFKPKCSIILSVLLVSFPLFIIFSCIAFCCVGPK